MNKNIFGSKLISGGEGVDSLNIKNTLTANKLIVLDSVSLPLNSIQIEDISGLQTNITDIVTDIDDVKSTYAKTTDVEATYATKTDVSSNYALKTDVPTTTNLSNTYATKTDVASTYATKTALDTNVTEVSNIKTKTADITKEGISTKIPTLWVTDTLYLTNPDNTSQNIDIGDTINYLKREVNTAKNNSQTNRSDIIAINNNLFKFATTSQLTEINDNISTNYVNNTTLNDTLNEYPNNSALSSTLSGYTLKEHPGSLSLLIMIFFY